MASTQAHTYDDTIESPGELQDALKNPRQIVLTPAPDDRLVLLAQRLRNLIGEPARRLAGRKARSFVAALQRGSDPAIFETHAQLANAQYGTANYGVSC